MSWLLTVGMLSHVYLTIDTVLHRAQTRNPIWGELVACACALTLFVLWGLLAGVVL